MIAPNFDYKKIGSCGLKLTACMGSWGTDVLAHWELQYLQVVLQWAALQALGRSNFLC